MSVREKMWKIVKGAAIASAGALIPVLLSISGVLSESGTVWGAVLGAVAAIAVNALRQWVRQDDGTT